MYHYLIIDDEPLIREGTIKKLAPLKELAVCIGEADNGKEGIRLIEEKKPDFVILDMQMPILDGTRLLPYLSEHYPHMPLIVISGYRDFDYIKHAISAKAVDYILKPFSRETVQKAVKDAISRIDSHVSIQNRILSSEEEKETAYYEFDIQMLKNALLGYHTKEISISSNKLSFISHTHNLLLLTLYFCTPVPEITCQDFLEENGFGDLALYLSHLTNNQLGFVVLFVPEHTASTVKQLSTQILEELIPWMERQGYQMSAGISNTHSTLKELHQCFLETSDALNGQQICDQASHYHFYSEAKEPVFLCWDKQDEFLFRIEAGMNDKVVILTKELFLFYQSLPKCTLADVKYHLYLLSGQCRLMMNYYFNEAITDDSSSMQNVISSIFSLEELESYYLRFFTNLSGMLKDNSVYASEDVVEKLKIYAARNYQKNLNMEFLASLFYMNRSYLSHLFRQKTGQKFVDYLNEVRVEKAKELLLQSDRKMYQIAKAAGYDNVKYFFRIFKKVTGQTPEEFRDGG